MKNRWLLFLGAVALLGSLGTASAMPAERPGAAPVGAPPDIRPFLAGVSLPDDVVANDRPGFAAYRPMQDLPTYMVDDFEAPSLNDQLWLKVWDLDADPLEFGEYYWALSSCRSAPPGSQSLWAIGGGTNGSQLPCGAIYPNGVASGAIMRLDLSVYANPTQMELIYDFYLNTRTVEDGGVVPDGLFVIYLYNNPTTSRTEWVTIDAVTSQYPHRFFEKPRKLNLLAAEDLYKPGTVYNLYSAGTVDIMFLFKSKRAPGGELAEGAFIDNIRIGSDVPPAGVTVTPTEPITPSATPEPTTETLTPEPTTETPTPGATTDTPTPGGSTDTPTPPTDTPTPTPTPTDRHIDPLPLYLPRVMR
jgi:hypothetical protein